MRPEVSTNRPGKRAGKRANLIHRGGEQRWPPLASAHYQAALQLEVPLHPPERQEGVRPLQGQARSRRRAACRRRPCSRRVIRIVTVSGSELSGRGRGWGGRTSAQMRVAAYQAVCLDQHYLLCVCGSPMLHVCVVRLVPAAQVLHCTLVRLGGLCTGTGSVARAAIL